MRELVEYLAKSLVEHPDHVMVMEEEKGDTVVYRLKVEPSDVGKVIGRHGRIAKAIRSIVGAAAYRLDKRVVINIDSPESAS
ncbi:KH domain-containing protein [Alicyclobacillus sp. SO9]|uniref:KH domain-containing protein n=1 Tax=Alicyclobacillus sp. SO9 TaxID=2665646 RepID=UPI0018E83124|nr:KH domain-containing protein [Alicyclobacillus sp. SO9]QQE80770.1 KH domain-containing protein [Alicyclobacillus sp. SO9]